MHRKLWFTGLVALALMIVAIASVAPRAFAQQTPSSAQTTITRSITVVGHGEVKARPDTALIQIGVETEAKSAKEALDQNSKQTAAVQKKLTDQGIDTKDLQTTGFNIYPTYSTDGKQITGYHVSNSVSVKIRTIDKTGSLLDQVVQSGANSVSGISFTVDNPRALQDQARELAIRDAKARADLLSKAAGASVGDVLVITENVGASVPMPLAMDRAAAPQAGVAVPIQPGEQTVTIDVQVTYALK
jgi:uncharacterized protein YggE